MKRVLALALSVLMGLSACGIEQQEIETSLPETNSCNVSTAVIRVGDGYFRIQCGCDEPAGQVAYSGAKLTCSIPAGTTVIFDFFGNILSHQILAAGDQVFSASPVSKPGSIAPVYIHAVALGAPGTYSFFDAFNTQMTGELIVGP